MQRLDERSQARRFEGEVFRFLHICFSPDGRLLAASGGAFEGQRDGRISIWDVHTGQQLRVVGGHGAPVRTIAYEETIGRWAWACKREKGDCRDVLGTDGIDPGPTKAVRGWHGKNWMFSRVFGDAHAEYQKVLIEGTRDSNGYFNHYWTELVFPDDPDKQDRSVCIIVRGDGWQVDTLPDEPIPTGMWWDGTDRVSYDGCVRND